ncbi:MAG TPA: type II toxin-antitoxin system Phd/YefM family antitoxin [Acidimicrobiales bacterium]|jgi:antitoxin (DNA-binding transcriptional repressor) of toxin-antitoxin stability system
MKVASVSQAKNGLSALLDLVRAGETVVIADRGIPVARLEGLPGSDGDARIARLERAGLVRAGTGDAADILAGLDRPPPRLAAAAGDAAVEAVLQERRDGR